MGLPPTPVFPPNEGTDRTSLPDHVDDRIDDLSLGRFVVHRIRVPLELGAGQDSEAAISSCLTDTFASSNYDTVW